jgi:hypothetical protein
MYAGNRGAVHPFTTEETLGNWLFRNAGELMSIVVICASMQTMCILCPFKMEVSRHHGSSSDRSMSMGAAVGDQQQASLYCTVGGSLVHSAGDGL